MDKRLIAERFARARDTYSQEARVQQQVAEKMLRLLTEQTPDFIGSAPLPVSATSQSSDAAPEVIPGYCCTGFNRNHCH